MAILVYGVLKSNYVIYCAEIFAKPTLDVVSSSVFLDKVS